MKRARRSPEPAIPTSSMADLAFLLIVFFLLTTVFASQRGIDFQVVLDRETEGDPSREAVHIQVEREGGICLDGRPAELEGILPYLRPKLGRWPDKPVLVTTDPAAPYHRFVAVYDELRRAGRPIEEGGIGLPVKNLVIPNLAEIETYRIAFERPSCRRGESR